MEQVRTQPRQGVYFWNTAYCEGRLLHFYSDDDRLALMEIPLCPDGECRTHKTNIRCEMRPCCCSIGFAILVICPESQGAFAFLARVGDQKLPALARSMQALEVRGPKDWCAILFLFPFVRSKALLCKFFTRELWVCEVDESRGTLTLRPFGAKFPQKEGPTAQPIALSGRRVLVVGSGPACSDIEVVTPGKSRERLGALPGGRTGYAACALLGGRFLVGFGDGEWEEVTRDDLWVFDLETRRGSVVWERGQWHRGDHWPVILVRKRKLYIIGGQYCHAVSSISLRTLATLIQEGDVREAFRAALGLPPDPEWTPPRPDCAAARLQRLHGEFWGWASFNTVQRRGEVYHVSQRGGTLVVSRALFGSGIKPLPVYTGVKCRAKSDRNIGCCSLDAGLLVVAEGKDNSGYFVALVSLGEDEGEGWPRPVRVTELAVEEPPGVALGPGTPLMTRVGEAAVWISFLGRRHSLVCSVEGEALRVRRADSWVARPGAFAATPVPLPGGRALVATASKGIGILAPRAADGRYAFQEVWSNQGQQLLTFSATLVAERVLVGVGWPLFGPTAGWVGSISLWWHDLRTGRGSVAPLPEEPGWADRSWRGKLSCWPFLVARDGVLYVVGGLDLYFSLQSPHVSFPLRAIALRSLARLIPDRAAQRAICQAEGALPPVGTAYARRGVAGLCHSSL